MSKLAFVADVHLGNPNRFGGPVSAGINARGRMVLDVFRRANTRARELGCERLVIAGDLADTSRWRPQWVRAAQEALREGPDERDVAIGNHDQESTDPGDHALGPLAEVPGVAIHERPVVLNAPDHQLWIVPFQPGIASEWLPGVLAGLADTAARLPRTEPRILVIHLGIKDAHTAVWLSDSPDAIDVGVLTELMVKHNVRFTFAGNWHDRRLWSPPNGVRIVQCGALCPTGWANPGLKGYGHLTVLDTATGEITSEELPGPRFLKVDWSPDVHGEINRLLGEANPDCDLFLELRAPPGALDEARTTIGGLLALGMIAAGEAVPDDSEAREQAQEAGRVARTAETLDAAIGGFVSTMPLDPDVPRAAVLEEIRRYTPRRSS